MGRGDKADASKPPATGNDLRLQYLFDRGAQCEIGIADDAGANPCAAIAAAGAHRRDTVGEFDFANRAHLCGPMGAVHRQPFEIDGRGDIVTAAGVGQEIRQQIAAGLRPIDQMMVRIDNRQLGIDDRLLPPCEPIRPHREMQAGRGRW